MSVRFQKIIRFFIGNSSESDPTKDGSKRIKKRKNRNFRTPTHYPIVSVMNNSNPQKTNAGLLLLIVYILIGIVLYQLVK
jgi:hypothetical protein